MCLECMFTVPGETHEVSLTYWVQWTPGLHVHTISSHDGVVEPSCSTLPIHAYAGRCIGSCVLHPNAVCRIRHTVRSAQRWTQWDSNPRHPPCKGGTLPLSYEPNSEKPRSREMLALVVRRCPTAR